MVRHNRLVTLFVTLLVLCLAHRASAFSLDDVGRRAKQLASKAFKTPPDKLPQELKSLSYDQLRDIRFRMGRALWHGSNLPFEVAFFNPGFQFTETVRINEVDSEGIHEIKYNPELFDYGSNKLDLKKLRDAGFAGFRVHYPINAPKYKDEVLVFLGASYFRALGKNQRYGLSARGLAIDTGLASGEEFPRFVEFWIERPAPTAKELTLYALLDSRRATGAYRFILRPGVDTIVDVKARLFLRENVSKLGLAPLTSMYFFGENQRSGSEDYRPEVHDSDGLSIQSGTGEWIWRPLLDPKRLLVSSFSLDNPAGFGLMQRDRNFHDYEDLEARYDLRPSVWVQPTGSWGKGRVELVQIPTPDETNDNIVAYWVPDTMPPPNQAYDFEYRMLWQKDAEIHPPQSWATATRRGRGYTKNPDNSISFAIDFEGPALKRLPPETEVEAVVTADANGAIREAIAHRNEVTGGWRLSLRLQRNDEGKPVELRAFLRTDTGTLSETWSYLLPPQ